MFTGEYRHTVDEKGRIAVPVRFRAELAGGALVSKWIDGCLALYPRAAWDALAARSRALPVTDAGARTFQRFIFGAAFEIELDRQGRLVVPAVLREFAEAGTAAVVSSGLGTTWSCGRPSDGRPTAPGWTHPEVLARAPPGTGHLAHHMRLRDPGGPPGRSDGWKKGTCP